MMCLLAVNACIGGVEDLPLCAPSLCRTKAMHCKATHFMKSKNK